MPPSTMIAPDVGLLLSFPAAILIMDAFSVPDTPIPPETTSAPLDTADESVVFVTRAIPATLALPSTNRLPLIPVPPWTTSDPVPLFVLYVSGCVQPSVKIDVPEV
jgi:hypothetical protein